jgi:hypothetical protein
MLATLNLAAFIYRTQLFDRFCLFPDASASLTSKFAPTQITGAPIWCFNQNMFVFGACASVRRTAPELPTTKPPFNPVLCRHPSADKTGGNSSFYTTARLQDFRERSNCKEMPLAFRWQTLRNILSRYIRTGLRRTADIAEVRSSRRVLPGLIGKTHCLKMRTGI